MHLCTPCNKIPYGLCVSKYIIFVFYGSLSFVACFVDSELPLDAEGSELLADVFDVLSLSEIKLTAMSGPAPGDEPPDDEMAVAKAVLQKKLISQVSVFSLQSLQPARNVTHLAELLFYFP